MTKKSKIIISIVSALFVIGIAIFLFISKNKSTTVEIFTIEEQDPISFSGASYPKEKQEVSMDATKGKIKEYYVKNDDVVEAGQSLFIYENETVKNSLDQLTRQRDKLNSAYNSSTVELKNSKNQLIAANNKVNEINNRISNFETENKTNTQEIDINNPTIPNVNIGELSKLQMELETAKIEAQTLKSTVPSYEKVIGETKAQLDEVNAQIKTANEKLHYTEKSMISGVVKLDKSSAEGAISMTSQEPIVSISSKETIVKGQVSEYDYEKIQIGDNVNIILLNSDKTIDGKITYIDNMPIKSNSGIQIGMPQQSGTSVSNYLFEVEPSEVINYGFSVNIKLPQEGLFIPEEAVKEKDGKFYVFMVKDGVVKSKEIDAEKDNSIIKIIKGLSVGDEIISNIEGIEEGQKVNIENITEKNKENNITPTDVGNIDSSPVEKND